MAETFFWLQINDTDGRRIYFLVTPAVLFCYWPDTVMPADVFNLLQAGWAVSIHQKPNGGQAHAP